MLCPLSVKAKAPGRHKSSPWIVAVHMSLPGPLTSFTPLQKCGRYRINSGQTAPSGLTGSAAFDPFRRCGASWLFVSNWYSLDRIAYCSRVILSAAVAPGDKAGRW
jgi:hypothetical protein